MTLLEKKVLIGFGQTGDHKTPRTSWDSTCGKILKENKYKGIGDFNFWPVRLGFFGKIFTRARVVVQGTVVQGSLGTGSLGTCSLGTGSLGTGSLGTGSLGTVPESLGTVPESLGTVPESLGTAPESLGTVP